MENTLYLVTGAAGFLGSTTCRQLVREGKKALMTTFSVYNLARNNTFDYSKAKEELGYTTRPCAETVRDEIAWLKKENKI